MTIFYLYSAYLCFYLVSINMFFCFIVLPTYDGSHPVLFLLFVGSRDNVADYDSHGCLLQMLLFLDMRVVVMMMVC